MHCCDGHKGAPLRTATLRNLAGGPRSARQLLPTARSRAGPLVRPGTGETLVCQRGQAVGGPGGLFFRLQLVMFFEGIRSERELMRVAADRLGVRWYLGVRRLTGRWILPTGG